MQIGFFDSGIGGITVLFEALKQLPNEDYIYYADTLNVPYGEKSKDEVKQYVRDAAEFMMDKGIKALVIACNTATSVAIEDLREKYSIPIIGMEPAVKPAVTKNTKKRILVTATELTLKEEKLKNLISALDNEHSVDLLPLPGLVQFAEKLEFDEEKVLPYLKEQLSGYDMEEFETVVLGCTHFSYYRDMFSKLFSEKTEIIDGNKGTVKNLKKILKDRNALNEGNGQITFYNSGVKVTGKTKMQKYHQLFQKLEALDESVSNLI